MSEKKLPIFEKLSQGQSIIHDDNRRTPRSKNKHSNTTTNNNIYQRSSTSLSSKPEGNNHLGDSSSSSSNDRLFIEEMKEKLGRVLLSTSDNNNNNNNDSINNIQDLCLRVERDLIEAIEQQQQLHFHPTTTNISGDGASCDVMTKYDNNESRIKLFCQVMESIILRDIQIHKNKNKNNSKKSPTAAAATNHDGDNSQEQQCNNLLSMRNAPSLLRSLNLVLQPSVAVVQCDDNDGRRRRLQVLEVQTASIRLLSALLDHDSSISNTLVSNWDLFLSETLDNINFGSDDNDRYRVKKMMILCESSFKGPAPLLPLLHVQMLKFINNEECVNGSRGVTSVYHHHHRRARISIICSTLNLLVKYIQTIPFNLWLITPKHRLRLEKMKQNLNVISRRYLFDRIRDMVLSLSKFLFYWSDRVCKVLLRPQEEREHFSVEILENLECLVKLNFVLLTRVPLPSSDEELLKSSSNLVSVLVEAYSLFSRFNVSSYMSAKVKNSFQSTKDDIFNCIKQLIGGFLLPSGKLKDLNIGMKYYVEKRRFTGLQNSHGVESFIEFLIENGSYSSSQRIAKSNCEALQLLAQFVKSLSHLFVGSPSPSYGIRLEDLIIQNMEQDCTSEKKKDTLKLLESYLSVRRDFLYDKGENEKFCEAHNVTRLYDVILHILEPISSSKAAEEVQVISMNCLSFYTGFDWLLLIEKFEFNEMNGFVAFLQLCRCQRRPSFHAAFLKSLGDTVRAISKYHDYKSNEHDSEYYLFDISPIYEVTVDVLLFFWQNFDEKVIPMAAYATGNLFQSIAKYAACQSNPRIVKIVYSFSFWEMCSICSDCLSSSNHKVQSNTIRTIAQIIYCYYKIHDDRLLKVEVIAEKVVAALTENISLVRKQAESDNIISWKQRSNLNKIGWGSCHSLRLLIPIMIDQGKQHTTAVEQSLMECVKCIYILDKANSKFSATLVSIFDDISFKHWIALCFKGNKTEEQPLCSSNNNVLLSESIVSCAQILYQTETDKSDPKYRMKQDSSSIPEKQLSSILVMCLSITDLHDLSKALSDSRLTEDVHDFLYYWLIDNSTRITLNNESSQNMFGLFELALNDCGKSIRISQKFSSRALQTSRREEEMKKSHRRLSTQLQKREGFSEEFDDEDEI